ncbi:MAG: DegT/DnrJ/EryC1/StrS family aminotransferase [Pelagibacteraceae bacterium]|nr:DegT/DnrJ/EryC1/StrS family aminotransferase [Pelagibacteraceae bacterium]
MIPVNIPKISSYEKKLVNECLRTNWISSEGKFVNLFEKNFSSFNKRKFGIAVSSGTAALEIAVKSLNLKKNSEVLIPSFSIISTANAVVKNNLKPVLIDCDLYTWNINVDEAIKKITKKTKAIIITHIYGLPVDLDKILRIAKKKNIKIIEDAAEVIGLKYKNKICGSFGDLSIFSFYANKHITTGEGGMICTNDKKLFKKCKSLRNLSFSNSVYNRFNHDDIGWNYRMTNLQAALGCGQLKNINWIVRRKREIGLRYYNKLKNCKNLILQKNITPYSKNIYWVFGVVLKNNLLSKRDKIMKTLSKNKIGTRPFFYPMNKQKIFKRMKVFKKINMPISEYISRNGFYLPSGLGLKNIEIDRVVKILLKIVS